MSYFLAGFILGVAAMVLWACGPEWNERRAFG